MSINFLNILEAREKLDNKEFSSVELTRSCLDRIKKIDNKVKAFITVCEDEALKQASLADDRMAKGEKGALLGIPYAAKDNILTKGIKTTAASKILENYTAPYSATIINRLGEAGAVLLGKTNLDEFAHGASTENSAFGPTLNPWDLDRVSGGSSGGSAAAVAADMCLFALGTDTGGSIRHPSSFCGVTGLKPTYGRSSRFGLIAMTSSTDVPGPITKTVSDAACVLRVIAGRDSYDATSVDQEVPDYSLFNGDLSGLRVGVPKECFDDALDADVKKSVKDAIDKLVALGAELVDINLPHSKYGVPVYYIITPSEISSNLARFDGVKYGLSNSSANNLLELYSSSRGSGFGAEAKRRIMLGTYALSSGYYDAYYLKAQKVRTKIKEDFDNAFSLVDLIVTPTAPHTAFKLGHSSKDPLLMYLEDIFVTNPSLLGLPAISIPCGFVSGLPLGFQLISQRFNEEILFKVGQSYQNSTSWHKERPNHLN